MRIRWLGYIPIPVFTVDRRPFGHDAVSLGIFILIHKDHEDDGPLMEHELHHCRMFYNSWGWSAIRGFISKRAKFEQETECYAVQWVSSGQGQGSLKLYANYLSSNYTFDLDERKARQCIREAANRLPRSLTSRL